MQYDKMSIRELLDLYTDKVSGKAAKEFWCGRQRGLERELLDIERVFHCHGIFWDKLKHLYDASNYTEPEDGGASTEYYEKLQEKLKKQILQDVKGEK